MMNSSHSFEEADFAVYDTSNESNDFIEDSFEKSVHKIAPDSVENSFNKQSRLECETVDDSLLSNRHSEDLNKSDTVKSTSFALMQKNPIIYSDDDSSSSDHDEHSDNNDSLEEIEKTPQFVKKGSDGESDSSNHEEHSDSHDSSEEIEKTPQFVKKGSEGDSDSSNHEEHSDSHDSSEEIEMSPQFVKKDHNFIVHEVDSLNDISIVDSSSEDSSSEEYESVKGDTHKTRQNKIIDIASSSEEDGLEIINDHTDSINAKMSTKLKQASLTSMVQNLPVKQSPILIKDEPSNTIYCNAIEYSNQASKVADIRTNILRCKNTIRTTNLNILPDKGVLLRLRLENEERKMVTEEALLKKMVVETKEIQEKKPITWDQLQKNSVSVVPRTFGKQAMATYTNQKSLTMDGLKSLHDSLAKCPGDDVLADDPKGLKIDLMPHQKRALAWLIWREHQKPPGGILADDMGLGKTLTMISLVIQTKEDDNKENDESEDDSGDEKSKWMGRNKMVNGGTLVICPATLLRQWEGEVAQRCRKYLLSVEVHHGTKRETKPNRLAKYDMVITTFKLAMVDFEKKGPLFRIKWKRIILDEAHVVRNHKSQTSLAVCGLSGKSRWALTGTPVHNKELDLYALLKFLRCSPFDDINIWKRWVANKNAGGQERLNTVMTSLMLRRTKEELQNNGALQGLPQKKYELIQVELDNAEKQIYQKILIFSRTLFAQFLHQRKEKDLDTAYKNIKDDALLKNIEIEEYNKMRKQILHMNGGNEVRSNDILVLLLRLRQICCHPSLIVGMLTDGNNGDEELEEGLEEDVELDIVDRINKLKLDETNKQTPINPEPGSIVDQMSNLNVNAQENEPENFNTAINKVLSLSNPVFAKDRSNEKIRLIKKIINEKVLPAGEKIIIVSQWTSMLSIVHQHLKADEIKCAVLDGSVPVHKRNELVVCFNDPTHKIKVLLLSLTAGGVGLNLVGANNLLLLDLHWNPQLESQAQDRIYRVGQTKTVVIYKLVTTDTIEERIKALQDNKLAMASDILSGTRSGAGTKLSLDDLRMLFNV